MYATFEPRFSVLQKVLMVVACIVVIAGGITAWIVFIGDDAKKTDTVVDLSAIPPRLVSLSTNSLTVYDLDGEVASTAEMPSNFAAMLVVDQGRWLVEDNRDSVVNYFDLAAEQPEMRAVELPFQGWAIHPATVRVGSDVVLLYSPEGELGLAVVNLADGTAYPIASARANYFLAGTVRDYLLFKEVDGLNTVIVPAADPTAFWMRQGAVVDIRGTTSLVAVANGPANFMVIYEGTKTVGARVQVENPIMGGMLNDATAGAVVLERSGALTIIENMTGKVRRAGVSEFGAQGAIPVADGRWYGWGGEGSALMDAAGVPVATYLLTDVLNDLGDRRPLIATHGGTGCLVLQPQPQLKTSGAGAMLVSTVDGAELLPLDASPSWVSRDGCTLIGLDGLVVIDGRAVNVELEQAFSVSRDGRSVLGRRTAESGEAEFVLLDVASGEITVLDSPINLFAAF